MFKVSPNHCAKLHCKTCTFPVIKSVQKVSFKLVVASFANNKRCFSETSFKNFKISFLENCIWVVGHGKKSNFCTIVLREFAKILQARPKHRVNWLISFIQHPQKIFDQSLAKPSYLCKLARLLSYSFELIDPYRIIK